ncbi:MAG: patatin-like phospholipase family protein [Ignavibacteriae bacterium]|nr:patatin-like phospholipase family protein [Ignavibacteria bacterium]MBI3364658.1 patatin-like phospholipase family protein [Ignavibacteriota bacterium]
MTDRSIIALRRFTLQLLLIVLPLFVFAQTQFIIRPTLSPQQFNGIRLQSPERLGRPKVGLVLSGGGARGLAQIGVLRALEKNDIPIDLIIGNSLGSVVGGLYAAGYSTTQIESIATHANWSELLSFSEETKRTDLFLEQKLSQQSGYLVIRFDGLEPIIPSAISGGQRLSNFFSYLTLQALYHPNPSFDDLKIPFRAIATDLISGKRVMLDRGSLAEAMRASVTVPLLYSPIERDSMYLVDGGLTSNIPVDIARSMGCDVVIVVNSTSSMRNASQLEAPWEIADQIMTIMMQENNERQLKLADIVITPDRGNRIVSDFTGIDSLIIEGERAATQNIHAIHDALNEHTKIISSLSPETFKNVDVKFSGDSISSEIHQEILTEIQQQTVSPRSIESFLNRIYSSGRYQNVSAEVSSTASPTEVLYHVSAYPPLNEITFSGNELIANDLIEQEIAHFKGKELNYADVQKAMEDILTLYREKGYSLARIESVHVDPTKGTLNFHINEGTIAQIHYEGNVRTKDYIIRREFPLDEGDIFNVDQAAKGITNIKSTGLFEYVLLDVRYSGNQPIIVLKVKEKSSELVRLGLYADNERSIVTTVDIRDANFRGAWEDFGLLARYGYRDRHVQLGYTVNRIFNTYFTFNVRGYFNSHDILTYRDDLSTDSRSWDRIEFGKYRKDIYGGTMLFGSHFERFGDVTAQLRVEHHRIVSISGNGYAPEEYHFASVRLQSTVDTENKFLFPTEGMYLSMFYESASKNLGSEVGFGKIGVTYEAYITPLQRHTIRPRITFRFADETLPIAEQFTLGGFNSFFGLHDDDSYGRQLFVINTEYRYALPFKIIFDTYIKVRYDLGTISLIPQELKLNSFRHGIGAELALDTPLGAASFGIGKSFYPRRDLPNTPLSFGPLLLYFSIGPAL